MSAEQIQAGLQALLEKLESIDLTLQDRWELTREFQRLMPSAAAG